MTARIATAAVPHCPVLPAIRFGYCRGANSTPAIGPPGENPARLPVSDLRSVTFVVDTNGMKYFRLTP